MAIPKCIECNMRIRKFLITNSRLYHECTANGWTICYGDKLPKTSPRWCPMRIMDKRTPSKEYQGPNEYD